MMCRYTNQYERGDGIKKTTSTELIGINGSLIEQWQRLGKKSLAQTTPAAHYNATLLLRLATTII